MTHLYLASTSPRRRELVELLDYQFSVIAPQVEELRANAESASQYVERLAREKAQAGVALIANLSIENLLIENNLPVIGADTIVVLNDQILEKPENKQHAFDMLRQLSGKTHQVMTAIAISNKVRTLSQIIVTDVTFCDLSDQEITHYIDSGEPMDKAGAYGIQGNGGRFVRSINGSYHAVVGLPLVETNELIKLFLAQGEGKGNHDS